MGRPTSWSHGVPFIPVIFTGTQPFLHREEAQVASLSHNYLVLVLQTISAIWAYLEILLPPGGPQPDSAGGEVPKVYARSTRSYIHWFGPFILQLACLGGIRFRRGGATRASFGFFDGGGNAYGLGSSFDSTGNLPVRLL